MTRSETSLAVAIARVQQEVDAAFDEVLAVPQDGRARLVEAMRYAVIGGGKRLRPLLLVSVAEYYGAERDEAIRAGCAIEAIHAYSLIHDDLPCMDDDNVRRGKPTVHRAFDEATAVLAGDALFALAFELLASPPTSGDPSLRSDLVATLARASGHHGMAGGQMLDLTAGDGPPPDLDDVTRLQELKTGALLGAAVEMGTILGRVGQAEREPWRRYASDIGLAFQIADDLIDIEGDPALAGKALRKDEEQNKQTFVGLLGCEEARGRAHELVERATGHLSSHGEGAALFRELARYIVERDR